jgi:hypothetical protein
MFLSLLQSLLNTLGVGCLKAVKDLDAKTNRKSLFKRKTRQIDRAPRKPCVKVSEPGAKRKRVGRPRKTKLGIDTEKESECETIFVAGSRPRATPPSRCNVCGKCFLGRGSYYRHKAQHEGVDLSAPCDICGKRFRDRNVMRSHVRTVHEITDESQRQFECETCSARFKTKGALVAHNATHATVKS